MKVMIRGFSIFVLFIMFVSCATTHRAMPEKYNFDNELEVVDQISPIANPSWQYVDKQALILINWDDYYLIVLRRPIYGLSPAVLDLITRRPVVTGNLEESQRDLDEFKPSFTIGTIHSRGFSGFILNFSGVSGFEEFYTIEKIYKFKGQAQKEEIRNRLRNY